MCYSIPGLKYRLAGRGLEVGFFARRMYRRYAKSEKPANCGERLKRNGVIRAVSTDRFSLMNSRRNGPGPLMTARGSGFPDAGFPAAAFPTPAFPQRLSRRRISDTNNIIITIPKNKNRICHTGIGKNGIVWKNDRSPSAAHNGFLRRKTDVS